MAAGVARAAAWRVPGRVARTAPRLSPPLTPAFCWLRVSGFGVMSNRITIGGATASRGIGKPIYARNLWTSLPSWISLKHERGKVRKCWEGHRLLRNKQDGRRHGECDACHERPKAGSPILSCDKCCFSVCAECNCRPRLPPLDGDPLFCGPHSPRLLVSPQNIAGMGRGTVIVCPGGNYEFLCPKEALPIAEWLASHGIARIVYGSTFARTFASGPGGACSASELICGRIRNKLTILCATVFFIPAALAPPPGKKMGPSPWPTGPLLKDMP
jgi:hypothetical protein